MKDKVIKKLKDTICKKNRQIENLKNIIFVIHDAVENNQNDLNEIPVNALLKITKI